MGVPKSAWSAFAGALVLALAASPGADSGVVALAAFITRSDAIVMGGVVGDRDRPAWRRPPRTN
jgi:acid phosphatase family membrane protein YuiD